ncbi:MAG: UUP1 family membrane protein [Thermodesulfobacteriota bacterium]
MKRPGLWLAVFLFLIPLSLIGYRVLRLGYPLLPTSPVKAWGFTMEIFFEPSGGNGKEIKIRAGLPESRSGQTVIEQRDLSGSLQFNLMPEGLNQIGVWSGDPEGARVLTYRATVLLNPKRLRKPNPPGPESFPVIIGDKSEQILARRLVERYASLKAPEKLKAIAAMAKGIWGEPPPDENDLAQWAAIQKKYGAEKALLLLLRSADFPIFKVQGFVLAESIATKPDRWIGVWTGEKWEHVKAETGDLYSESVCLLPLMIGDSPLLSISGGRLQEVRWNLTKQTLSQWRAHFERIYRSGRFLDRWSLFGIPNQFQEIFRILLLVPLGVLMISVLRNIVGFPTFGIFMPVLMALAFRSTGLYYGLGIFAGVVLIGYLLRRAIDRLRLLLVPRLSFLITFVILAFNIFALIGSKFGVREFMAVGLLPFVILSMTIERFFILIEESGAFQALRTAAGSAAVAAITYKIIQIDPLQLTFFVYPELLFVIMGLLLLLGNYSGYRLSEILRFKILGGKS